ncbi:ArnT family glycosyltransferase [Priestia filamentosa]|uniref:ArnT family glycosyltransferase n=1 Tax=Priestia filamentosa TaxID=1402861 RepID=UPI00397C285E
MINELNKGLYKLLIIMTLSFLGLMFYFSWRTEQQYIEERLGFSNLGAFFLVLFLLIILGALLFSLSYYIRKLKSHTFLFLLICVSFSVRLVWILTINTPPATDFRAMYDGAVGIFYRDWAPIQREYFYSWPYQLGFTVYESFLLSLFGEGTFSIKFFNVLYGVGTVFFTYKTSSLLFNELAGRIAGIFYAFYIPAIVMTSVLTNQYIAIFFFYWAFYLLIKNGINHKWNWIFIGALLAIGDIMRPLGAFILLAVSCYVFLAFLKKGRIHKERVVKKFIGIFVVFYFVHYLISASFIAWGITEYPLSNCNPLWKFVLGFNHETEGQYSVEDAEYVARYSLGTERNEVEKELIKERLEDKSEVAVLLWKKFNNMWGIRDESIFWSMGHQKESAQVIHKVLYASERMMFLLLLFGGIAYLLFSFRTEMDKRKAFFLILILGYVLVHLLVEVQTKYRFFINPALAIIASLGFVTLFYHTKFLSGGRGRIRSNLKL